MHVSIILLSILVLQINEIWVSKSAASEREKTILEQKFKQKLLEFKGLQDNFNKLKEEDRMKDIFLKERDNVLKEKTGACVISIIAICKWLSSKLY